MVDKPANERRDLECVLLGFAIANTAKGKKLLAQFSDNAFSVEFAPLFKGLKVENGEALYRWLAARGTSAGEGRLAIDAICERIHELNLAPQLKRLSCSIAAATKANSREEMLTALRLAIEELESSP